MKAGRTPVVSQFFPFDTPERGHYHCNRESLVPVVTEEGGQGGGRKAEGGRKKLKSTYLHRVFLLPSALRPPPCFH